MTHFENRNRFFAFSERIFCQNRSFRLSKMIEKSGTIFWLNLFTFLPIIYILSASVFSI